MGLSFCLSDGVDKPVCRSRRLNLAPQNAMGGNFMSIEGIHGIVIPAKIGSGQGESGKSAFGA
jgi:hypothetical protein